MEDEQIIDLFFQRSEQALGEMDRKYGPFCHSIAYNILGNREDAKESVSDTYYKTWNTVPPTRPRSLRAFLAKLTRHISIDRWRQQTARKRGGSEAALALEELGECTDQGQNVESQYLYKEIVRVFRAFLDTLPDTNRDVFIRRYFLLDPIAAIASDFGFSESKVKSMLHRTRKSLREALQKEDLL